MARFKPPTVEEVKAYCLSRGNSVDPENFVDFYECKGWMVGKNKMVSWEAAVRTWEKRQKEEVRQKIDWDSLARTHARPGETMADFKQRWKGNAKAI